LNMLGNNICIPKQDSGVFRHALLVCWKRPGFGCANGARCPSIESEQPGLTASGLGNLLTSNFRACVAFFRRVDSRTFKRTSRASQITEEAERLELEMVMARGTGVADRCALGSPTTTLRP
jgi:hypothetical protein